jgi:hypothetical protein
LFGARRTRLQDIGLERRLLESQWEADVRSSLVGITERLMCFFRGHEFVYCFERDRFSLRCVNCKYQTSGWTIAEVPQTPSVRPSLPQPHGRLSPRSNTLRFRIAKRASRGAA